MRRSTRIITVVAVGLVIAGGAAAATSDTGKEYIAQAVDKVTLPAGCTTEAFDDDTKAFDCTGVPVKDVLTNKKIAAAQELFFSKSSVAGADFRSVPGLVELSFEQAVDPGSLAQAASTAKGLRSLTLWDHKDVDFSNLSTDAAILNVLPSATDSESTGRNETSPVKAPKASPKAIFSEPFLELSRKSAGDVRALVVGEPIDTNRLDLSAYSKLDKLSIMVPKGTGVTLPKHLDASKSLQVSTSKKWTTYEN